MGKQPASSLPEDRSEWPSFLSGGSLPKVEPVNHSTSTSASSIPSASSIALPSDLSSASSTSNLSRFPTTTSSTTPTHHLISSSVPNPQSSGPRLHDYALKAPGGKVVVTQVRPGLLLGVNNDPPSTGTTAYPMSIPAQQFTPTRIHQHHHSYDYSYTPPVIPAGGPNENNSNNPTWSLPNSSMRSHGRSLSSLSGSISAQSEDGDIEIEDVDEDEEYEGEGEGGGRGRVLMRNGRPEMGMDDEDDDEHHDNDDDDNDNEEEDEEEETQSEIYSRYSSRYHAPGGHPKSSGWDGIGDMDMDMDMDMD